MLRDDGRPGASVPPFAALRLRYLRRIVGTVFGAAGIERATAAATWIARNLFDLHPPARKRVEANLLAAYGHTLSAARQEQFARAAFDNIARFWVEALFARRLLRSGSWQRFVRVADPEMWQRLAADPRPAILVTAYFGNIAVGAYALGQIFRPVHVLIDRITLPVLGPWQDELYAERNVCPIARKDAVHSLPSVLDAGGKILVIGEHARREGSAIEVPFLGGVRRCYSTIGVLAARHNARVIVFSTCRFPPPSPPFRFELRCHDMIGSDVEESPRSGGRASRPPGGQDARPPTGDPVCGITARYMAAMEQMIRELPEQYDWARQG